MDRWIVKLNSVSWIRETQPDVDNPTGITLTRGEARKFEREADAVAALNDARTKRPFAGAQIAMIREYGEQAGHPHIIPDVITRVAPPKPKTKPKPKPKLAKPVDTMALSIAYLLGEIESLKLRVEALEEMTENDSQHRD